jgi:hypothetical protein
MAIGLSSPLAGRRTPRHRARRSPRWRPPGAGHALQARPVPLMGGPGEMCSMAALPAPTARRIPAADRLQSDDPAAR